MRKTPLRVNPRLETPSRPAPPPPQTLANTIIAVLVASGFEETHMTTPQRTLTKAGAQLRIISSEPGLVNGWHEAGWGHFFPVDYQIEVALGADFHVLILPGGERNVNKLRANLHSRRIIGHFLDANKPIAAVGDAITLLAIGDKIQHRQLATPERDADVLTEAQALLSSDPVVVDGPIITAASTEHVAYWCQQCLTVFSQLAQPRRVA